uniref:AB hydrolase-1 domain-containing protein n=1 Tax=Ganoderma boninense TaxID=34458 RepID=A0A5K1K5X0_9APHY|nr:Uncharacterized protein [Ganoderma boninense]
MSTKEGYIPFTHLGQTFETYFKTVGDLDNPTRPPLVVIHGGPGFTHDYLLPHTDLANQSTPVIFYDQVGNGRSSHFSKEHMPPLNIEFFVAELENLLKYFGIQDEFHIVGHSWGGMLAAEFAVRRHPKGLKRLVISNSPAAVALRVESTNDLLKKFPRSVQDAIAKGEAEDGSAWRDAIMAFYAQHGCRAQPFPEELVRTFAYAFGEKGDRTVARAGLTRHWSIVDRVHDVDVPTLVISGRYDFVQDYVTEAYAKKIPGAKWVKFGASSHMPFWEERSRHMEVVGKFLKG